MLFLRDPAAEQSSWSARSLSNSNTTSIAFFCVHTQQNGALLKSLLQSPTASHPGDVCLPASCLSQLTHGDDPEAFVWVYEGLAVACGPPEEEQQPRTVALEQHCYTSKFIGVDLLGVLGEIC